MSSLVRIITGTLSLANRYEKKTVPPQLTTSLVGFFSGPTNSSPYEETVVSNLIISSEVFLNETNETVKIKNMLKTFWETESIGIVEDSTPESQSATKVVTTRSDCRERRIAFPCLTTTECAKHVCDHCITNWRRIRICWTNTKKLFMINKETESSKEWQNRTVKPNSKHASLTPPSCCAKGPRNNQGSHRVRWFSQKFKGGTISKRLLTNWRQLRPSYLRHVN